MAKKLKGTYSPDVLKIYNTPPEAVDLMSPTNKAKWQNTIRWVREEERKLEQAEKAARAAKMPKTAREIAKWLNSGRRVFAKNQEAERIKTETLARNKLNSEEIAAQTAAIRAKGQPKQPKEESQGKIVKAVWGTVVFLLPFDVKFKGLKHGHHLLVQLLSQALAAVGLLPPDHPARRMDGAKETEVRAVFEEAALHLPSLRDVWAAYRAGARAECIIFTRQYAMFVGMAGALAITAVMCVTAMWQVLVGVAHAADVTGLGSFTASGDIANNILDGIFGTGSSSLVHSGLGSMFAFYSNMILTFAGIILLWIIISAVAETARTGIPFGKQFNHVWVPIRLIMALGLLVPLGTGLNSGQYIMLSLAKWGSNEATQLWTIFSTSMIGAGTTSGLTSAPMSVSDNQQFTDTVFKSVLCQQVNNTSLKPETNVNPAWTGICSNNPATDDPRCVEQNTAMVTLPPVQVNAGPDGTTTPAVLPSSAPLLTTFTGNYVGANNPSVNCGGIGTKTAATPSAGTPSTASTTPAADAATQAVRIAQNAQAIAYVQQSASLANAIAIASQSTDGTIPIDPAATVAAYKNNFTQYMGDGTAGATGGLTGAMAQVIKTYNGNLLTGMVETAQQYGWMYAPVWIENIATQNGILANAVQQVPSATGPASNVFAGNPTVSDNWIRANQVLQSWQSPTTPLSSPLATQNYGRIANLILSLTNSVGGNPLGKAGAFGTELLTEGFTLITPNNDLNCFDNPGETGCSWAGEEVLGHAVTSESDLQEYDKRLHIGKEFKGGTLMPSTRQEDNAFAQLNSLVKSPHSSMRGIMFPIGMIMVSMGWMLKMLPLIPLGRFTLGILNWLILVFEAELSMPFVSLSLMKTEGEGLFPQQVQTNMVMGIGVVVRPMLMIFGLCLGLVAFNAVMTVLNILMAPTVQSLVTNGGDVDSSYLSLGVYVVFYTTLAYTLANSAFKLIDILPNFVMGWLGQRMETRVDDASMVQQQAQGYMQTMAYSMRGGGDPHSAAGRSQAHQEWQQQQQTDASTLAKYGFTGNNAMADYKAALATNNPNNPQYQQAVQAETALSDPGRLGASESTAANVGGAGGGTTTPTPNNPPKSDHRSGGSKKGKGAGTL